MSAVPKQGTVKLEPTASLVMQMSLPLYRQSPVKRYIERLDLSSAEKLLSRYKSICPWYDQVILNRKYFIRHFAQRSIKNSEEPIQVIIPAAGKAPLSLELLLDPALRDNLSAVFELDITGLDDKDALTKEVYPELQESLHLITADLSLPGWEEKLFQHPAYKTGERCLIILEGISYYLTEQALLRTIELFRSAKHHNQVLLEYKISSELVSPERQFIPEGVFAGIQEECGISPLTHYSEAKLRLLLAGVGASLPQFFDLAKMELLRTGQNQYFNSHEEGWVECVVFRL